MNTIHCTLHLYTYIICISWYLRDTSVLTDDPCSTLRTLTFINAVYSIKTIVEYRLTCLKIFQMAIYDFELSLLHFS